MGAVPDRPAPSGALDAGCRTASVRGEPDPGKHPRFWRMVSGRRDSPPSSPDCRIDRVSSERPTILRRARTSACIPQRIEFLGNVPERLDAEVYAYCTGTFATSSELPSGDARCITRRCGWMRNVVRKPIWLRCSIRVRHFPLRYERADGGPRVRPSKRLSGTEAIAGPS